MERSQVVRQLPVKQPIAGSNPAASAMTDTEAIALYVAAGNPREDWPNVDEPVRSFYRKMALEMVPARGFEPRLTASKAAILPLDEAG
jgi:hypothetical protein